MGTAVRGKRVASWLGAVIIGGVAFIAQGGEPYAVSTAVSDDKPRSPRPAAVAPALGPLRVHSGNPRYFSDGSGKAVYLTGSHQWNNFQDSGEVGQPPTLFDYDGYLDVLDAHHHNFIRLWVSEGAVNRSPYADPLPYLRTGPGTALDGKPKVDVKRFNRSYFDRLRSRVIKAGDRGIYVGIMLFNGWSVYDHGYGNPWRFHPFHKANNVNGIDGDSDGDGEGREVHGLTVPAITARQEAYVRMIVDTVNDLDNVLYEITNETARYSKDWQYHMIRLIHEYERTKPKQHPVGMTSFDASWKECEGERLNEVLLSSPADWIAPCGAGTDNYVASPPSANGRKVILSDTDHLFGIGGDHNWVWKTFTRGLNPIYMDPLDALTGKKQDPPEADQARRAMGDTRSYAERIDLATMIPRAELCSSGFCLANPGIEYLVYAPFGSHWLEPYFRFLPSHRFRSWIKSLHLFRRTVVVDIGATPKTVIVEWFNPITRQAAAAGTRDGSGKQDFTAPFSGDAVLYLTAARD
jgi:hypothetical protein